MKGWKKGWSGERARRGKIKRRRRYEGRQREREGGKGGQEEGGEKEKRENDEMSAMIKVACAYVCVCVVNARIQLFCDYNATGDWTVGWLLGFDRHCGAPLRYVFLRWGCYTGWSVQVSAWLKSVNDLLASCALSEALVGRKFYCVRSLISYRS